VIDEIDDGMAFAAHMLPVAASTNPVERERSSRNMLLRALNLKTTVAVIGSGCSVPLGYPKWSEFADRVICRTIDAIRGKMQPMPPRQEEVCQTLAAYRNALKTASPHHEDFLMHFIGTCQEVLREEGLTAAYETYITEEFGKCRQSPIPEPPPHNPYRALIDLPIRRFVTTNYDCEIENALVSAGLVNRDRFAVLHPEATERKRHETSRPQLSFNQKSHNFDQLAIFALGWIRDNRHMVFHCHGRFDEPDSIIASESDYQKWYISEGDHAAAAFRQSVALLLGSNPLLFVGYGLHDDDLLRPLRHLKAADPSKKPSRPIFALLERSKVETDRYYYEMLYERYGLQVISYGIDEGSDSARAEELCRELAKLRVDWQRAREEWLRKPAVRSPRAAKEKPEPYLDLRPTRVPLGPLPGFEDAILKPGIVNVIGPAGSGKSLHCLRLVERLRDNPSPFAGVFFWNFHYGNELLIAIDTMLSYFDPQGNPTIPRHERLLKCFCEARCILILDGCERLLRKGDRSRFAPTYSVGFKQLLRVFADRASISTVVMAGRLLPAELEDLELSGVDARQQTFPTLPMTSEVLQRQGFFEKFDRADVSALCSLLKGHNYGLLMAQHYLQAGVDDPERLRRLLAELAARTPDQRLREMIRIQLREIDRETKGLAKPFLERLTLFISGISEETFRLCFAEARKERSGSQEAPKDGDLAPELKLVSDRLFHSDFLFKLADRRDGTSVYSVHATIRSQLLQPFHGLSGDALPDFGLSGFLSGRVGVDPGLEEYRQVEDLFEAIETRARQSLDSSRDGGGQNLGEARNLCRDAFSLIRGRMEANTAARWCKDYFEYARIGIKTARLAKRVSPNRWSYCEQTGITEQVEHQDGPLYLAELAWLYNDVGLALNALGQVRDAYSMWEQTYEIGRLVERPETGSGLQIESLFNLCMCFIDMGMLPAAKRLLDQIGGDDIGGLDEVKARVHGITGLIDHLHGNLRKADGAYDSCIEMLAASQNLRALSIFLKHRADLQIAMGKVDYARQLIRESRAVAEGGVFPDLVLYLRVTEGHLRTKERSQESAHDGTRFDGARVEYRAVLREAQRLKMRKLEAEVEFSLARLALDEGDAEAARQLAMRSLTIANELGLSLRITHSLVVLGLAMLKAEQPKLGIAYLRHARRLAYDQEYWHRGWEAERKLQELGETDY
jgi:hypothetical protein